MSGASTPSGSEQGQPRSPSDWPAPRVHRHPSRGLLLGASLNRGVPPARRIRRADPSRPRHHSQPPAEPTTRARHNPPTPGGNGSAPCEPPPCHRGRLPRAPARPSPPRPLPDLPTHPTTRSVPLPPLSAVIAATHPTDVGFLLFTTDTLYRPCRVRPEGVPRPGHRTQHICRRHGAAFSAFRR